MTSKWIYNIKHAADGIIEKHKVGFMVCGLSQKEGTDYEETFAPVARDTYVRSILSLVAIMKWRVDHMDAKTTFLNGVFEEEVYVEQPLGFETHDR